MVLILNGPNLNLLGQREPEVYGRTTLEELEALCEAWGAELGLGVAFRQTNYEGQLIEWVQQAHREGFMAIVLNPGALTHYSYALLDAIKAQPLPVVEVHLSNLHAREPFRQHSVTAGACRGIVSGFGPLSYKLALTYLAETLEVGPA
ncbi:MAG: type II 3-dehydroquinate dehydratase [Thermus sp.]|uniref:type II 3-dehydroquinate dehydratase n=1 Tax=unclassified Thermus TaxID=2619321 RepID=UPI000238A2CF|nr:MULTISPECIES: type II 3-dehydroquinate dehydratase [unclassified Thermus]AEV15705.1 3-dehydroquinate dehydratase [Thermus sp. CCB_US3_UF1]MCS6869751.1 type II 3-dehydroquinate dehydratase [Thermus sp.]MCS7218718.1 type II 3-dehydroquinate dehydratase [Thermus sp.]MCX7849674.1 type II 3-dehydroquinate dehydratase [Thermus sp.]MDW8016977.1 type II 3-dehydroquinate dehydratase [Thermus sp.]